MRLGKQCNEPPVLPAQIGSGWSCVPSCCHGSQHTGKHSKLGGWLLQEWSLGPASPRHLPCCHYPRCLDHIEDPRGWGSTPLN